MDIPGLIARCEALLAGLNSLGENTPKSWTVIVPQEDLRDLLTLARRHSIREGQEAPDSDPRLTRAESRLKAAGYEMPSRPDMDFYGKSIPDMLSGKPIDP
jgi:hypothetical protein